MKNYYYPVSWSERARKMCDAQVRLINLGLETKAGVLRFFSDYSCCSKIVSRRAMKRFHRLDKKGKIHESLELFKQNCPIDAEQREILFGKKL
jgi:hypothetical protein